MISAVVTLYQPIMQPHLDYCVHSSGCPISEKYVELEGVDKRGMKVIP